MDPKEFYKKAICHRIKPLFSNASQMGSPGPQLSGQAVIQSQPLSDQWTPRPTWAVLGGYALWPTLDWPIIPTPAISSLQAQATSFRRSMTFFTAALILFHSAFTFPKAVQTSVFREGKRFVASAFASLLVKIVAVLGQIKSLGIVWVQTFGVGLDLWEFRRWARIDFSIDHSADAFCIFCGQKLPGIGSSHCLIMLNAQPLSEDETTRNRLRYSVFLWLWRGMEWECS